MWTAILLLMTAIWLFLGWFYVFEFVGFENFLSYNPDEIGVFLLGFFGPAAFVWLVGAYLRQIIELRHSVDLRRRQEDELVRNSEVMARQSEELRQAAALAEHQSATIAATEASVRRDAFLRFADLTTRDLNTIVIEFVRETAPDETMTRTLESMEGGYHDAFFSLLVRSLLGQDIDKVGAYLARSAEYPDNIQAYVAKFDRLLGEAAVCEPDGHLGDHLQNSAMGRLYDVFVDVDRYFVDQDSDGQDTVEQDSDSQDIAESG